MYLEKLKNCELEGSAFCMYALVQKHKIMSLNLGVIFDFVKFYI